MFLNLEVNFFRNTYKSIFYIKTSSSRLLPVETVMHELRLFSIAVWYWSGHLNLCKVLKEHVKCQMCCSDYLFTFYVIKSLKNFQMIVSLIVFFIGKHMFSIIFHERLPLVISQDEHIKANPFTIFFHGMRHAKQYLFGLEMF